MKPKYKPGTYVMCAGEVECILGVHLNIYESDLEEYVDNVQYEFYGSDDWVDEDAIEYEMVRKK